MNTFPPVYPPMPAGANEDILKPSPEFKRQIFNVIAAIVFFVLVYIILFLAGVFIALIIGFLGFLFIKVYPSFITLVTGGGLILSGVMLIYFLVKFLFKRNKIDYSGFTEITAAEHPALFDFIRQITQEAGSSLPKRVFITPDVNASVSFNSSFWSMFLPDRKNLKIGLGLVNSLNQSEFKAVLAHEFGHFTQRSMKFGSYVYQVNHVIFNLLNEDSGYQNALNSIANLHSFMRMGVMLNIYIVRAIQHILRKVYVVVNKTYLGLSRQMEYQADAIAAYVSGSNNTISMLRRLELGDVCYHKTLDYWNRQLADKKASLNVYPAQSEIMRIFAGQHRLEVDALGIPVMPQMMTSLQNSRLDFQNQWTTHPSNLDREKKLQDLNLTAEPLEISAWKLFTDPEALQEKFTKTMYEHVPFKDEVTYVDQETFEVNLHAELATRSLDKFYKGYYDDRMIKPFDTNAGSEKGLSKLRPEQLFTDENCNLPNRINGITQDLSLLESLANDSDEAVKTFDFEGTRYTRYEAYIVKEILNRQLEDALQTLSDLDERIYHYFHGISNDKATQLKEYYETLFKYQQETATDNLLHEELMKEVNLLYNNMTFALIQDTMNKIYPQEEKIKPRLTLILLNSDYEPYISEEQRGSLENYLSKTWIYFNKPHYDEPALLVLNKAMSAYSTIVNEHLFQQKKKVLNLQIEILSA